MEERTPEKKSKERKRKLNGERRENYWLPSSCIFLIPRTKVGERRKGSSHLLTYMHAAQRPRQVGVCLKHLPSGTDTSTGEPHHFNNENVPWQRVVNSKGMISHR